MEPISPKHITVTDPFWAPRIRTVADIVLPYQWQVLHDQVPGAPKSSCIANFQKAAHAIAAAKPVALGPPTPRTNGIMMTRTAKRRPLWDGCFRTATCTNGWRPPPMPYPTATERT